LKKRGGAVSTNIIAPLGLFQRDMSLIPDQLEPYIIAPLGLFQPLICIICNLNQIFQNFYEAFYQNPMSQVKGHLLTPNPFR
jgi:hypothetical protein